MQAPSPAGPTLVNVVDLCPACARRPQEDPETGFCARCLERRAVDRYLARQADRAASRTERWRVWTSRSKEHQRERQHYSRLLRRVRPREPAWPTADPLELADEALRRLELLRPRGAHEISVFEAYEGVAEAIKQLAWGPAAPEDGAARERPRPSP